MGLGLPPKGKHIFGIVKVGDKGQIVIPAKARKVFDIQPGENLIVLGDEAQGIALIKEKGLLELLHSAGSKEVKAMKKKIIPLLGIAVLLSAAGGMRTEAAVNTGATAEVTVSETENEWYGNLKFHIPDSWTGHFYMGHHTDADGTYWTEFCEEPDFSAEGMGWLCSVIQVKNNDVERYKYLPSFDYIGEIRCDNGETYGLIVEYPTDVQPSIDQMELYGRMYEDIKALVNNIEVGNGASLYKGEGGLAEFVLPLSDCAYLTEENLLNLSKAQLRIARNEIYARHGRRFRDQALQAYFDGYSWYHGTIEPGAFKESVLTECERENLKLILRMERR